MGEQGRRLQRFEIDVGRGHDVDDAGHRACVVDVDRLDATVRRHRPDERHVEGVGRRDVVDVGPGASQQRRVLDPLDPCAEDASGARHDASFYRNSVRRGSPEEKSLAQLDPQPSDGLELRLGLDALGDDRGARLGGEVLDAGDERALRGVDRRCRAPTTGRASRRWRRGRGCGRGWRTRILRRRRRARRSSRAR